MKQMVQCVLFGILLAGCGLRTVSAPPVITQPEVTEMTTKAREDTTEEYVVAAARLRAREYEASKVTSSETEKQSILVDYLDAGIAVSRINCDTFFRGLQQGKAAGNFARSQVNLAGSTAISAMGLAGVASPYVAGAGAALGIINSTFDNFDNSFLVSPDIVNVEGLVNRAQAVLEQQLLVNNPPHTFGQAQRALVGYDHLCTYAGMKQLLNQSVVAAKPTVSGTSASDTRPPAMRAQLNIYQIPSTNIELENPNAN